MDNMMDIKSSYSISFFHVMFQTNQHILTTPLPWDTEVCMNFDFREQKGLRERKWWLVLEENTILYVKLLHLKSQKLDVHSSL